MKTEKKYEGYFYLPQNKDNKVFGMITYYPNDEILIELAGSLIESEYFGFYEADIILGDSLDGKKLTLYKCYISNRSNSFPGYVSNKYSVLYLFIGAHFSNLNSIIFTEVYFQFNNLDKWLDISGFKIDDSKHQSDKELKITFKLPERVENKLDERTSFGFSFSHSEFRTNIFQRETHLEQNTHLYFKFDSGYATLDTILDLSNAFQSFLAMATLRSTYPYSIILFNPNVNYQHEDKINNQEIQLIYKRNKIFDESRSIEKFQMLFTYQDIKSDFQKIFLKWLTVRNDLEPSINLLFEYFYKSNIFTVNHFLNIIHAVETYHRRMFNNYSIDKEDHEKRLRSINESVPEEYREWLKEKLSFSHEPSLKERLIEIIDSIKNDVLLEAIGNKDEFIRDAKNSRNYYIHFSERLKEKALKGSKLYYLSEKLKYILIYSLLKDTGISEEIISNVFTKNKYELFGFLYFNDN